MQIAPGVDARDWSAIQFNKPEDWGRAVAIFEARIRGRFTDAIDVLVSDDEPKSPTSRRWGFAILAIDCLLVETLQAFRDGHTDTEGLSRALSVKFLTTRPAFSSFFTTTQLATRFYYEFRCGLAHNAQVFGTGRVWSVGKLLLLNPTTNQIVVNRTAFHKALVKEIDAYVGELADPTNVDLRASFRKKMDFIATEQFVVKTPRIKKR